MPGHPFLYHGPPTVEVAVAVTKGQGLEWDTANPGKVKPWTAGATRLVGIAHTDAAPAAANAVNNFAPLPRVTAAQVGPTETRVTYAAAAAAGDLLVAAADGKVTPIAAPGGTYAAADITNTRAVVGRCTEPAGVAAGAVGRCRLYI
jgi:hypothetical protein